MEKRNVGVVHGAGAPQPSETEGPADPKGSDEERRGRETNHQGHGENAGAKKHIKATKKDAGAKNASKKQTHHKRQ